MLKFTQVAADTDTAMMVADTDTATEYSLTLRSQGSQAELSDAAMTQLLKKAQLGPQKLRLNV